MSTMFIRRSLASIVALLIASSAVLIHGQSPNPVLSDDDEAAILETLVRLETKRLGSDIGHIKTFSSANLSRASAARLAKLGFSLITMWDIEKYRTEHVIDYVAVRSIRVREGTVFINLSAVTEGRPCFAPAFSRERSFTYTFQKSEDEWFGRLVKRSAPFPFSRSLATIP